jgi:hypothetical protein
MSPLVNQQKSDISRGTESGSIYINQNKVNMEDSQRKFDAAVHVIRSLPKSG